MYNLILPSEEKVTIAQLLEVLAVNYPEYSLRSVINFELKSALAKGQICAYGTRGGGSSEQIPTEFWVEYGEDTYGTEINEIACIQNDGKIQAHQHECEQSASSDCSELCWSNITFDTFDVIKAFEDDVWEYDNFDVVDDGISMWGVGLPKYYHVDSWGMPAHFTLCEALTLIAHDIAIDCEKFHKDQLVIKLSMAGGFERSKIEDNAPGVGFEESLMLATVFLGECLRREEITAYGVPTDSSVHEAIPTLYFLHESTRIDPRDDTILREGGEADWTNVKLPAKAILKVYKQYFGENEEIVKQRNVSSSAGRPPNYPWSEFHTHLEAYKAKRESEGRGRPNTHSILINYMISWCDQNWEKQPGERTIGRQSMGFFKSWEET